MFTVQSLHPSAALGPHHLPCSHMFLCTLTHVVLGHVGLIILIISNTIKSKNIESSYGWINCGQSPRMDHVWTMSTGGSRVENFHGWATCGQLVTGGAHVGGRDFP